MQVKVLCWLWRGSVRARAPGLGFEAGVADRLGIQNHTQV